MKKKDLPNPVVRLGLACNEHCLFCNVPPESHEISGKEYAFNCVNKAKAGSTIPISGGEPTLYPFLPELIALAKSKNIITELQTNAILLADENKVKALAKAGLSCTMVSFHSHIERVNDFLTGTKGSWKKCLLGIKNLQEFGIGVMINVVLTTVNYSLFPDFISFLSGKLNIKSVSLSVVQPRNRAAINKALIPDYSKLDESVRIGVKIALDNGIKLINAVCGLPLCIGGWENYPQLAIEYLQAVNGMPFDKDKIKAPCCQGCAAQKYCVGVWRWYPQFHGFSALKPFKHFPNPKRKF